MLVQSLTFFYHAIPRGRRCSSDLARISLELGRISLELDGVRAQRLVALVPAALTSSG